MTSLVAAPSSVATPSPSNKGGRPRGGAKGRSNRRSIPVFVQKLVAADVEEFGGLETVQERSFREFADFFGAKDEERASIHGEVSSKERERVGQRVNHSRSIGPVKCNNLLQA